MSNILSIAENWQETNYDNTRPPTFWDGTKYTLIGSNLTGRYYNGAFLTYENPYDPGDSLAFTALNHSAAATLIAVLFNGATVASQTLTSGQSWVFNQVLPNNNTVAIHVGAGQFLYSQDLDITPLASPPIAPDEFETVAFNSHANGVDPIITVDGAPIGVYTLAINAPASHGLAAVSGKTLLYTPTTGYFGPDSFTYHANNGQNSNVATVNVNVLEPACDELGRTTRSYVTGYNLARVVVTRVRRSAKRCVVANFNGALPPERSIVSVMWETTSPWSINMSNARIASGLRQTMVDVFFNFAGWGGLLATVTLDNGEIYNAEFSFTVQDAPLYPSAIYPTGNGPFKVTASI